MQSFDMRLPQYLFICRYHGDADILYRILMLLGVSGNS
jgi:hypothetical protein